MGSEDSVSGVASPSSSGQPLAAIKGRGAASNREGRFEARRSEREDDGWDGEAEPTPHPDTTVVEEKARSILTRNDSPDIPFDLSINPYRGCEHGCIYCYARPTHGYLNLSSGLDFETRLFAKTNAAELLRAELARPGYACTPINIGGITDPYQPVEQRFRVTRAVLEVLAECRHPVTVITKSARIEQDLDLLQQLAREGLVQVFVSVTTLDNRLASKLEPRASAPHRRLAAIRRLREGGIPVGVMVAPIIPMVTDRDLEAILEAAHEAGALSAGYVLLRLPHEVKELFREWLALHFPDRAAHVMSLVRQMRGGRDNDARFGSRMRGEGPFAQLIQRRFELARARHGLDARMPPLARDRFRPPRPASPQGELF